MLQMGGWGGWQGLTSKCSLGTWGRQEGVLRTQKMGSAGAADMGERPNGAGQKDRVGGAVEGQVSARDTCAG